MAIRKFQKSAIAISVLLMVIVCLSGQSIAQEGKYRIVVTLPDITPIAKAVGGELVDVVTIMPPGADPHAYTLTAADISKISGASLIVFGHGGFLHFEEELKAAAGNTPTLDFPDYQQNGAELKDFPGYAQNRHGSWLSFDNAIAIATTIGATLIANGLDSKMIAANLASFASEVRGIKESGQTLMTDSGLRGSSWVAMVSEIAYVIDNLGLDVGAVLLEEGSGTVSGESLNAIEAKLKSGEFLGIVGPISMKESKPGEIARQIASDTKTPVCYVQFLTTTGDRTFVSQAAYNAGSIASAGAKAANPWSGGSNSSTLNLIWGLIVFGLIVALIIQNRHRQYGYSAPKTQFGVFLEKGKKSKK
jgi:zinc/manganese transport system substrate-binding protein